MRTTPTQATSHWDIFCTVVDNYGDIGVTWRLAKQLVAEYKIPITLWVDDLHSFSHILPQLCPHTPRQQFYGVTILQWNTPLNIDYVPGAVVIEAFACDLPPSVINALLALHAAKQPVPFWLNLEYLSAEDWVDGCHGLPSLQASGLKKYFYFPGFTPKTGGLICERDILAERQAWQASSIHKMALFSQLGLSGIEADDKIISVFSYESKALSSLVDYWQYTTQPIHLLIPKGRSLNSLRHLLPCAIDKLVPGQQIKLKQLTLHILPMTDQQGYDRLLWSCDFNIVRGEDSFLRAQWAAKPFIWHIYPQEDDYHLVKLEAFLRLYCDNLAPEIAKTWTELTLAFNQEQPQAAVTHWQNLDSVDVPCMQSFIDHANQWPVNALNAADLATRLVQFVKNS